MPSSRSDRTHVPYVLTPIHHPVLSEWSAKAISIFKKERAVYRLRLSDLPEKTKPISLRSSIDAELLAALLKLESLKDENDERILELDKVTDDVIEKWMEETLQAAKSKFSLSDLAKMVGRHKIEDSQHGNLVDATRAFFLQIQVAADNLCPDSLHDNAAFIIPIITRQLEPTILQGTIRNRIRSDEEKFLKGPRAYIDFVQECVTVADSMDGLSLETTPTRKGTKRGVEGGANGPPPSKRRSRPNREYRRTMAWRERSQSTTEPPHTMETGQDNRKSAEHRANQNGSSKGRSSPTERPRCLNEECPGFHFMRDCQHPTSTAERKKQLISEYIARRRQPARARKLGDGLVSFRATLGPKEVPTTLAADTQSNICLIPTSVMEQLRQSGVEVVKLPIPVTVRLAMGAQGSSFPAQGMLTSKTSVDVALQVAHGRALQLREVTFYAGEGVDACLLSGPVLAACGLDVESVLVAAAEHGAPINCHSITSATPEGNGSVARRLLSYSELHAGEGDGTSEADDVLLEFGEDDETTLRAELEARISEAVEAGLPTRLEQPLRKIVMHYIDAFALRLGPRPPADVPPMRNRLKTNTKPFRAKVRAYPGRRREILGHMTKSMTAYGFAYTNPSSPWACAPLLVPKAPPVLYRFTVDLRPANLATIPEVWPLPHLDTVTDQLRGSTCFASLDFCSGYWQLPLHHDDQHIHSFITPDGVFTPTRTMQGAVNSGANFQRCVAPLFEEALPGHVLAYLDDIMIHFDNEASFLEGLERCFALCRTRRLVLSARKTTLFTRRAKWCGRLITAQGTSLDPRRASALRDMSEPRTPLELSSFLYAVTWMSKHIPHFAALVSPLRASLNAAYLLAGRRTNAALKRVSELLWGREQREAFFKLQEQLRNTIELAHPNPDQVICIHTDASEYFWSSIITQTDPKELLNTRSKQKHEPLVFASGAFNGSQSAWSTFDKEAFAIFRSFLDHGYLMEGSPHNTRLFTDHRNLMYVYSPTLFDATLGKHVISRVQRWAIFISKFRYTIEHVAGNDNVIADMFTRWARGHREQSKEKGPNMPHQDGFSSLQKAKGRSSPSQTKATAKRLRICNSQVNSLSIAPNLASQDFEWPSVAAIKAIQRKYADRPQQNAPTKINKDRLFVTAFDQIWIPHATKEQTEDDVCDLQVRILCIGHAGMSGHRSTEATLTRIRSTYWWLGMEDDIKEFVQHCIHCIAANNGERIPRPLSSALHATKPFEVIHFDYLAIGPSSFTIEGRKDPKYLLLIKDDLTSFCWLVPACSPDALTAADALARWEASFGSAAFWISDGGSHFTAAILKNLRAGYRHVHHVTTAYCPQANGTVERLCREVLRGLRALESEFRLGSQDWPSLINIVQGVINSSYLRRLGKSPMEAAFGRKEAKPILRPTGSQEVLTTCESISQVRAQQVLALQKLQESLDSVHRDTNTRVTSRRAREILNYNKKTNVKPSGLEPGDFVMVRQLNSQVPSKTKCKWTGPRRIVAAVPDHDEVYEVEHILSGKKAKIHASRIAPYREGGLLSEMDICRLKEYAEHADTEYFVIEKLQQLRKNEDTIQILVEWLGYPEEASWTWEPIEQLYEDVPEMVRNFLREQEEHPLYNAATKAIGAV